MALYNNQLESINFSKDFLNEIYSHPLSTSHRSPLELSDSSLLTTFHQFHSKLNELNDAVFFVLCLSHVHLSFVRISRGILRFTGVD